MESKRKEEEKFPAGHMFKSGCEPYHCEQGRIELQSLRPIQLPSPSSKELWHPWKRSLQIRLRAHFGLTCFEREGEREVK